MTQFLIQLALIIVPLVVFGLIIGRTVERRHFRSIEQRENDHRDVLITQLNNI